MYVSQCIIHFCSRLPYLKSVLGMFVWYLSNPCIPGYHPFHCRFWPARVSSIDFVLWSRIVYLVILPERCSYISILQQVFHRTHPFHIPWVLSLFLFSSTFSYSLIHLVFLAFYSLVFFIHKIAKTLASLSLFKVFRRYFSVHFWWYCLSFLARFSTRKTNGESGCKLDGPSRFGNVLSKCCIVAWL